VTNETREYSTWSVRSRNVNDGINAGNIWGGKMKYRDDLEGKVINIGDQYFTIHFQEDLDRRFERLGQCDLLKGLIWLDAEAPVRPILSTLIHEVVEAIVCNCALEIKHDKIVILENTLFSFCMNNPDVLEIYIREAHEKTGSKGRDIVDMTETDIPSIEAVEKLMEVKDEF